MWSSRSFWRNRSQLKSLKKHLLAPLEHPANCFGEAWPALRWSGQPQPQVVDFASAAASSARNFVQDRKTYAEELHKLRVEWQERRLSAQKQQQEAVSRRQQKRSAARTRQQKQSDDAKAAKLTELAQQRVAQLEQQVLFHLMQHHPCQTMEMAFTVHRFLMVNCV